jgi:hypothetical protein
VLIGSSIKIRGVLEALEFAPGINGKRENGSKQENPDRCKAAIIHGRAKPLDQFSAGGSKHQPDENSSNGCEDARV